MYKTKNKGSLNIMTTIITIKIQDSHIKNVNQSKKQQICPYSLTELVHLYKLEFPNGCYNYDYYVTSPFYQTYILGKEDN